MKRHLTLAMLSLSLSCASTLALARNTIENYSIKDALATANDKVGDDIALYFAGQPHASVTKRLGQFATNKKTNALGRSDMEACQHVFLTAVIALQERARRQGGDAVVNIKSNYQNELRESATEFTCGAGGLLAGVALTGEVVKLRK